MKLIKSVSALFIFLVLTFAAPAQVTQQWASGYNGPVSNSTDIANATVADASGNVYVTGSSGNDYATTKYNSAGAVQWVSRYNGTGNGADDSRSIAVDASGNVYVTGSSLLTGTNYDIATIKYNSSGVQQWASRYNGPANDADMGSKVAVDAAGNVYVTGKSIGSGSSWDYVTIKYNSAGVQQWASRYNGTGNSVDEPAAIAIDISGNVYVTGTSYSASSSASEDCVTIKYSSAGVQLWSARYNGTGNNMDYGKSIAVDAAGSVYVTGGSYSGASYDTENYLTLKYNSSGVQQWVQSYNGTGNNFDHASSLVIDAGGNVYVTGNSVGSGTSSDFATVKYNGSGAQQWASIYNGPANGYDEAYSIALDASGNIYVTGMSNGSGTGSDYATIKYNSSGAQQWVQRYTSAGNYSDSPKSVTVDGSGNVCVTGYTSGATTSDDYTTIKYNSSGVQQWIQSYYGMSPMDEASSVTVDASGNVYVTGYSRSGLTAATEDYATIKYNSSGAQQWVQRYNGAANGSDDAYAIAVDLSGNVYVTGICSVSGGSSDCVTIKYNAAGVQQWVQSYNGPGNGADEGHSIAVDASGNVFVTGKSTGTGTNYDYVTIKYSTGGVLQWTSRYDGPASGVDAARFIKLDASGNIYVTGNSAGATSGDDYATVKYNSAGVQQWASRYDGTGNYNDYAYSLAVDASGNVFITGWSTGNGSIYDYATIKYNSAGAQQWATRYNGPGNGTDGALSIAIDGSGNSYVTGVSAGTTTGNDYATIKYNSTGVQQWIQRYNGAGNGSDIGYSIVSDAVGNVYVTGSSTGNGTNYDYATIKYNTSGTQQWEARYNGLGNASDNAYAVVLDGTGNIYVAGGSTGGGTELDFVTIKYSQLVGVQPVSNEIPDKFALSQNYPNPFNPSTKIKFSLPNTSEGGAKEVKLVIYDILGNEIEILANENLKPGDYEVEWNASNSPSGVYFYKITAGDFNEMKKMILIK